MLRWISENTKKIKNSIRNEEIRFKVVVAPIDEKWWQESLEIVWSCSKESD